MGLPTPHRYTPPPRGLLPHVAFSALTLQPARYDYQAFTSVYALILYLTTTVNLNLNLDQNPNSIMAEKEAM